MRKGSIKCRSDDKSHRVVDRPSFYFFSPAWVYRAAETPAVLHAWLCTRIKRFRGVVTNTPEDRGGVIRAVTSRGCWETH